MGGHLDPTYISESETDMHNLTEPGWYMMDDNHRMIDGPYSTREECEAAIKAAGQPDPIEGFHFTDYDPKTGTLTIEVSEGLFTHAASLEQMGVRAIEIMGMPGVDRVTFTPRKKPQP